ncbi:ScyD/ScyE family protein [Kineococcus gynurae]|uniref:ScyD/ScyE family protein n=1 Tax=Kineococcus gynurae TaxID=452979 RepID=A0ABV5LPV1_9ACTN
MRGGTLSSWVLRARGVAGGLALLGVVTLGYGGPVAAAQQPVGTAAERPYTVLAEGLGDPREIAYAYGRLYVTENSRGRVLSFSTSGAGRRVERALVPGPTAVARTGGTLLVATGRSFYDDDQGSWEGPGLASVSAGPLNRAPSVVADLEAYRSSLPEGDRPEASDPQALLAPVRAGRPLLVADAGLGAVLAVDRATGTITPFFTAPGLRPTGLAHGPDGSVYVTSAGSGADLLVLDGRTGALRRSIFGIPGASSVAVSGSGAVYVAQEGFERVPVSPEVWPTADVGQITRVAPDGTRSVLGVQQPHGLALAEGRLYATLLSSRGFGEIGNHPGQLVRIDESAFTPVA